MNRIVKINKRYNFTLKSEELFVFSIDFDKIFGNLQWIMKMI